MSTPTPPFTQCPAVGAAPSCDILLVVNSDQTITVTGNSSIGPYDGSDDTLVGIVNNSNSAISSITVSGPGSGLAGFDGDGICTYATGGTVGGSGSGFVGDSYCDAQQLAGTDPGDYSGPDNSFTLDPNSKDDVEVDFNGKGLTAGGTSYFSLEGALTAAVVTARKGDSNRRGMSYLAIRFPMATGSPTRQRVLKTGYQLTRHHRRKPGPAWWMQGLLAWRPCRTGRTAATW